MIGAGGPRVSVVIPAYNEGENIVAPLARLIEGVQLDFEVVVVVDFPEDTTIPVIERLSQAEPRIRVVVSTYGRGPANAIRFGIDAAIAPTVVVTMADGCDDPRQIDELVRLVGRVVVVVLVVVVGLGAVTTGAGAVELAGTSVRAGCAAVSRFAS